ncbi:amino acid ABC transporter substrate-binding protein [Rhodococcoides fascians]|nr:amino acid ABC transporter substrate-binding protein [Rhodococcus sp. 06-1460-1B]OZE89409.1 amino acid ABC transporter substrate-binding protein [Rhodococcus fascians]OZF17716.1 amino acid ABC transporter substrate-binding protein [Rhodococcus fascians]OZF22342.1 amino acid ABC transporter substrate-binding protein [Rhodococcus fascians]OZF67869.1 amino acid ABC transporter substrate-binding protein [Rhodococcus fascians]
MNTRRLRGRAIAAVAATLALTLGAVACSDGSSGGTGENALAGSDQASLDKYTTDSVTALDQIDTANLGLIKPGTLYVGTLSDAPPNIFIDDAGNFTGFDNELLKAVAAKLNLTVEFSATEFSGLLAAVNNKVYDAGSSSISTTDARRQTVGFTNGYDFGEMALVAKNDYSIKTIAELNADQRIAVVQGTVQDDYVTNTLGIEPVRFPDYNTAYANVKSGQVDAWVAPSQQATGQVKTEDGVSILEKTINTTNFTAYAVAKDNQPLIDALNAGLDAVVDDGTWSTLEKQWYPDREVPTDWKPGSKASVLPAS